jgi:hypothetical protein
MRAGFALFPAPNYLDVGDLTPISQWICRRIYRIGPDGFSRVYSRLSSTTVQQIAYQQVT